MGNWRGLNFCDRELCDVRKEPESEESVLGRIRSLCTESYGKEIGPGTFVSYSLGARRVRELTGYTSAVPVASILPSALTTKSVHSVTGIGTLLRLAG